MRVRALLLAVALCAAANAAAQRTVDLGAPGALEALERDNPRHFGQVAEILREVSRVDPPGVEGWLRARFNAQQIAYSPRQLRTSYPAKTTLSFTLDDTRYHAMIVVRAPAEARRAK